MAGPSDPIHFHILNFSHGANNGATPKALGVTLLASSSAGHNVDLKLA